MRRRPGLSKANTNVYGPVGKMNPPPLPDWAYPGVPIPRKNTGPNLTAEALKRDGYGPDD